MCLVYGLTTKGFCIGADASVLLIARDAGIFIGVLPLYSAWKTRVNYSQQRSAFSGLGKNITGILISNSTGLQGWLAHSCV